MGDGFESRCVGRVYGADVAVRQGKTLQFRQVVSNTEFCVKKEVESRKCTGIH